jgi:hypothetical protein
MQERSQRTPVAEVLAGEAANLSYSRWREFVAENTGKVLI